MLSQLLQIVSLPYFNWTQGKLGKQKWCSARTSVESYYRLMRWWLFSKNIASCRRLKGLRYYSLHISGRGFVRWSYIWIVDEYNTRNTLVVSVGMWLSQNPAGAQTPTWPDFCLCLKSSHLYLAWPLASASKSSQGLEGAEQSLPSDLVSPRPSFECLPSLVYLACFSSKMKSHLLSETFPNLQGIADHFFYILLI